MRPAANEVAASLGTRDTLTVDATEDAVLAGAVKPSAAEVAFAILPAEDAFELTFEVDELPKEDLLTVLTPAVDTPDMTNRLSFVAHHAADESTAAFFNFVPTTGQEAALTNVDWPSHCSSHHSIAGVLDE